MLNFAKVCCLCVAIALILALSGAPADAFLSTNCVATDGSDVSLLLQVKKKKKHEDGQSQNDAGLTECTIVQPGGGGGCKGGFKWVCEKMKSGNKCCGCVADKNAKQAPAGQGGETQDNVLTGDYTTTTPKQAPAQGGAGKTDSGGITPIDETPAGTLLLPYCEEKDGKLVCPTQP
jgi:hypothetical protein